MTGKNSFVFYHDWAEVLKKLPADEVKNVILALAEYSESGKLPDISPIADIAFTAFKQTIDRDTEKWENVCKRNTENVKKRWKKNSDTKNTTACDRTKSYTQNTDNDNVTDTVTDNENDNKKKYSHLPSDGETDGFERFWQTYPRKKAKDAALKAWKKLKPDKNLLNVILAAIEREKLSDQWRKDNGQFIPYPATWLNGRRWEDDLKQSSQTSPKYEDFDPNDPYKAWRENSEQLQLSKKYDDFDPADPYRDWE